MTGPDLAVAAGIEPPNGGGGFSSALAAVVLIKTLIKTHIKALAKTLVMALAKTLVKARASERCIHFIVQSRVCESVVKQVRKTSAEIGSTPTDAPLATPTLGQHLHERGNATAV
jgi:hypothetical protein